MLWGSLCCRGALALRDMEQFVICHRCSQVYILCSASVCHLAQPEPCRPSCQLAVPSRKLGLVWGGS